MPYVENSGVKIYYEVIGEGKPLVMIPGFKASMEDYKLFGYVDELKEHFKLILIDSRGFGKSGVPDKIEDYTGKKMAKDVLSVLDELGIEKASFLGYSLGSWIILNIAKIDNTRIDHIVLGGFDPRYFDEERPNPFIEYVDKERYIHKEVPRIGPDDLDDIIPELTAPCFLFAGTEDDFSYPMIQESADLFPNVKKLWLKGKRHIDAFEDKDLVLPHIIDFLNISINIR